MKAPLNLATERLALRKPKVADAALIFARYAGDPEVGRYLAWPIHETLEDKQAFLEFSDSEWRNQPAGPYLVFDKNQETLLGSTGLSFELPHRASTGYVIARDAWGNGYATEAVMAMRELAAGLDVKRLYAACHHEHQASRRVLEKAGFAFEGILRRYCEFPNLQPAEYQDVAYYAWTD